MQHEAPPRRQFLRAASALGAGALLPGCAGLGEPPRRKLIDTHHHFFAPPYMKAWVDWGAKRGITDFATQSSWTRARSLEEMDKAGVQTGILSLPSTPGVWLDLAPAEAARMARICNEYAAEMMRDHPGRFGLFAALPMIDIDASLKELAYALDVLKADGVGLQTNYGDKWPGDRAYRPVFEELNRRKALVYFHPLAASCCGRLSVGASPAVIEVPHDTTRAVVSLLLNGSFARYREIRWLFSHGGGTVPMLAGRMEYFFQGRKDIAELAPNGVEAELKRLHYDTANATHPSSMAALLKLIPDTQIVFGTDYPYVPAAEQGAALRRLGLSAGQLHAIERGNAMQLLPRLRG